jgi:hypothetical protein
VLAQVLFLGSILFGAGAVGRDVLAGLVWEKLVCAGLVGLAWGFLFSGWLRTTLGAILAAAPIQAAAAPLIIGLGNSWSKEWISILEDSFVVFGLGMLLILGPLTVSAVCHAWDGPPGVPDRVSRPAVSPKWLGQLAALAWLELRQNGRLIGWLAMAALVTGLLAALGISYWPLLGLVGWPLLTLLVGVSFGIAAFAGEQAEGTGRFLAEQRLPPGMVWTGKVGLYLVLAVAIAFVVFLGAQSGLGILKLIREDGKPIPLAGFDQLEPFLQLGPFFTLFLGYGFSVGCLCGLLFSKRVVAGFLAIGFSLFLVLLWMPSMLVGGLHLWQIWGTPILLLLTVRLLVWPWATGRLGSASAATRLASGLTLAALWLAASIGCRVVEVPLVEDKRDLTGFEKMVEADRRNEAGPLVRDALRQIAVFMKAEDNLSGSAPLPGKEQPPETFSLQLRKAVFQGWPDKDPKLGARLDEAFRQPWARQLADAAHMPLGIVTELQGRTWANMEGSSNSPMQAVHLLAARGLHLQAQGDPAAFVDNLEIGLALVRHLSHAQPPFSPMDPIIAELHLFQGVERWLERLGPRPDLLRRALHLLHEHGLARPRERREQSQANLLVARNSIERPEAWLSEELEAHSKDRGSLTALVALAWRTPWEQARLQRLLRVLDNQPRDSIPAPKPLRSHFGLFSELGFFWRARLEVPELLLALRLYEAETGKPAQTLQDLTPRFLLSVPIDAATNKPLYEYRLSRGEEVLIGTEKRTVPEGQGILVGPKWGNNRYTFLVPLPPGKEAKP